MAVTSYFHAVLSIDGSNCTDNKI